MSSASAQQQEKQGGPPLTRQQQKQQDDTQKGKEKTPSPERDQPELKTPAAPKRGPAVHVGGESRTGTGGFLVMREFYRFDLKHHGDQEKLFVLLLSLTYKLGTQHRQTAFNVKR